MVGVVDDVRDAGPLEPPRPTIYVIQEQAPQKLLSSIRRFFPFNFFLKYDSISSDERLRNVIASVSSKQAISKIKTGKDTITEITSGERLGTVVGAGLGAFCLLLTLVSVFSLSSAVVLSQKRRFAVMRALGAQPIHLVKQVLKINAMTVGTGAFFGIILGLASQKMLSHQVEHLLAPTPLLLIAAGAVLAAGYALSHVAPIAKVLRLQAIRVLKEL